MTDNDDGYAGGGHIIRTLVFGLIANAFDVGSDLLNAFQYYRYLFAFVCVDFGLVWVWSVFTIFCFGWFDAFNDTVMVWFWFCSIQCK